MKKFLVTILALVYLTGTAGAMMRLDCCLEKLVAYGPGTSTKDNHWSEESKGNCKDDHKQAKLGHEQKRNDSHIRLAKIIPALISTDFSGYSSKVVSTLTEAYAVNSVPQQRALVPLFILNCVHRI